MPKKITIVQINFNKICMNSALHTQAKSDQNKNIHANRIGFVVAF